MRRPDLSRLTLMLLTAAGIIGLIAAPGASADSRQRVDVSGRWIGIWIVAGEQGGRTGAVVAEFAQAGATGAGKLVLHDTLAAEAVPTAVRLAGGGGVRVVLTVSGERLRLEHELGRDLVTAVFDVSGDRMSGRFARTEPPVRVTLWRVAAAPGESRSESARASSTDSAQAKSADAAQAKSTDAAQAKSTDVAQAKGTDMAQAKSMASDLASHVAAASALADRANRTAEAAAELAQEAAAKAEASAVTAREALTKAGRTDHGASEPTGGQLHAVASTVVTFAFDKATLDDAGQTALAQVAEQARAHPDFLVNLEGYTDARGTPDYNIQLSQRRATAVLRYLVEKGVELSRIHWVGLGMLPGPGTPAEQAKKRRVTVRVMSAMPGSAEAPAHPADVAEGKAEGNDEGKPAL